MWRLACRARPARNPCCRHAVVVVFRTTGCLWQARLRAGVFKPERLSRSHTSRAIRSRLFEKLSGLDQREALPDADLAVRGREVVEVGDLVPVHHAAGRHHLAELVGGQLAIAVEVGAAAEGEAGGAGRDGVPLGLREGQEVPDGELDLLLEGLRRQDLRGAPSGAGLEDVGRVRVADVDADLV